MKPKDPPKKQRPTYNVKKLKTILGDIPEIPKKYGKKKAKPRLMAVVNNNCTGCRACVEFCPVDCIETLPAGTHPDQVIQPVQIRFDECIGCSICAKVCDRLAWEAIDMISTEDFERETSIKITNSYPENPQSIFSIKGVKSWV